MGTKIGMVKILSKLQTFTESTVSPWTSSGIFPRIQNIAAQSRFKSYCWDWMKHQKVSHEGLSSCRWTPTSHGERKTIKKNVWHTLRSYFCMQGSLVQDNGHYWFWFWEDFFFYERRQSTRNLGQYREKDAVGIRWERVSNFPCYDSIVQRSTQKQKTRENCRFILQPFGKQLRLFFAQLFLQIRSVFQEQRKCDVMMGQLIVFSAIKTEVLLENDDPAYQNFLLQQYEERIEKPSQQDRLIKFCLNTRFFECCWNWTVFHDRGMFMIAKLESVVFMGKSYSDNWHSLKNTKDFTMKQMFDISVRLNNWLGKLFMEIFVFDWWGKSIFNARRSTFFFRFCIVVFGKNHQNPDANEVWK